MRPRSLLALVMLAACGAGAIGAGDQGDAAPGTGADGTTAAGQDGRGGAGSSGGSGGTPTGGAYHARTAANGVPYTLHTPAGYSDAESAPLLVGLSGTEGGGTYAQVFSLIYPDEAERFVVVAIGGPDVGQDSSSGELAGGVMNEVKSRFNVDLSQQYLNTVSYGTVAGLALGFGLEQDEFSAIWFTAPIAAAEPELDATALGFAPGVGTAYGEASSNGSPAGMIRSAAEARGYAPVIDFSRPGGHSPSVPSAEWDRMWQMFAEVRR